MGFKGASLNQLQLFPYDLDELISDSQPVRNINEVIDGIDIQSLIQQYSDEGCPAYHPRMLLKVLVYAYLNNIYSSREIERAVQENIHFMWLTAMQRPDHNTINRFRSSRLKPVIKTVFSQVVLALAKQGIIDLQDQYIDGSTLEANANRYTFVWGKNLQNNKQRIRERLEELWQYTEKVAHEELKGKTKPDLQQLDPKEVQNTVNDINEILKKKAHVDPEMKRKASYAKRKDGEKLERYHAQEQQMGKHRNSYSKTDPGATFMRTKDDPLGKAQLRPAYNLQLSTNNQFILNYSLHQKVNDATTLKTHLEQFKELFNTQPKEVVADAGYGTEENYHYLAQEGIQAYVKYKHFDKEQRTRANKQSPFWLENLYYNEEKDCFYCPMGQPMTPVSRKTERTSSGFKQESVEYQAQNCAGCPLRGPCHRSKGNKKIKVNHNLRYYRSKANELLTSKKGQYHRSQRSTDVETLFGIIKKNKGFKRFMLRGLEKINVEMGLLAIAHNIKKAGNICCPIDPKGSSLFNTIHWRFKQGLIKTLLAIIKKLPFFLNYPPLRTNFLTASN